MYKWLFTVMPGPKWLRCIEMGILVLAVVAALFQWGFPWAAANIPFLQQMSNFVAAS